MAKCLISDHSFMVPGVGQLWQVVTGKFLPRARQLCVIAGELRPAFALASKDPVEVIDNAQSQAPALQPQLHSREYGYLVDMPQCFCRIVEIDGLRHSLTSPNSIDQTHCTRAAEGT